jgi:uridine kinase
MKIEELIIHKKKVDAIKSWFLMQFSQFTSNTQTSFQKILIISGPTGCGKSECIRTICEEYKIDILKWDDIYKPLFSDDNEEFTTNDELYIPYYSKGKKFEDFLFQGKRLHLLLYFIKFNLFDYNFVLDMLLLVLKKNIMEKKKMIKT